MAFKEENIRKQSLQKNNLKKNIWNNHKNIQ